MKHHIMINDLKVTKVLVELFGHIHIPQKIISTKEGGSDVLLGPDHDIEFLKHLMNILL